MALHKPPVHGNAASKDRTILILVLLQGLGGASTQQLKNCLCLSPNRSELHSPTSISSIQYTASILHLFDTSRGIGFERARKMLARREDTESLRLFESLPDVSHKTSRVHLHSDSLVRGQCP